MKIPALFLACVVLISAAPTKDQLKAELAKAEADFCAKVAEAGIGEGFHAFMAEQAFDAGRLTLSRAEYGEGLKAARARGPAPKGAKLTWAPMMVDVSDDGTLGYTWGKYEFTPPPAPDGTQPPSGTGLYLTIWKRQADGSWKFVYDGGPRIDPPERLQQFLTRPDLPKP
jgi:hypothetical protein